MQRDSEKRAKKERKKERKDRWRDTMDRYTYMNGWVDRRKDK